MEVPDSLFQITEPDAPFRFPRIQIIFQSIVSRHLSSHSGPEVLFLLASPCSQVMKPRPRGGSHCSCSAGAQQRRRLKPGPPPSLVRSSPFSFSYFAADPEPHILAFKDPSPPDFSSSRSASGLFPTPLIDPPYGLEKVFLVLHRI